MEEEVKAIAVVAMTQLPWVCTEDEAPRMGAFTKGAQDEVVAKSCPSVWECYAPVGFTNCKA